MERHGKEDVGEVIKFVGKGMLYEVEWRDEEYWPYPILFGALDPLPQKSVVTCEILPYPEKIVLQCWSLSGEELLVDEYPPGSWFEVVMGNTERKLAKQVGNFTQMISLISPDGKMIRNWSDEEKKAAGLCCTTYAFFEKARYVVAFGNRFLALLMYSRHE